MFGWKKKNAEKPGEVSAGTVIKLSDTEAESFRAMADTHDRLRLGLADVALQEEQVRAQKIQAMQEVARSSVELQAQIASKVKISGGDPAAVVAWDFAEGTITLR